MLVSQAKDFTSLHVNFDKQVVEVRNQADEVLKTFDLAGANAQRMKAWEEYNQADSSHDALCRAHALTAWTDACYSLKQGSPNHMAGGLFKPDTYNK